MEQIKNNKYEVESIWKEIFSTIVTTFHSINLEFNIYYQYIDMMNDDDQIRRDLETYKSKNIGIMDDLNVINNFYTLLFHPRTGVVIVNGDKNREGVIEKTNPRFEEIFNFNKDGKIIIYNI